MNNGIIGGWAIANGDHFATYDPVNGVSYLSNTNDGFATYDSGDLSTANAGTGTLNYNDGSNRTIAAGTVVNAIRNAPGAGQTLTLNGSLTLTSGGLLTNGNQVIIYTGGSGSLTSSTGALNVFVQQNRTEINVPITGAISLVKAGSATLRLGATNTYTGTTYFNGGSNGGSSPSGTVELNRSGANGTTIVSIPGDLVVGNTTVTELIANQIVQTANVTITGGGILNMHNSAANETLASITFEDASGDNTNRGIITRTSAQAGNLNLTAATAIISSNSNPTSTPTISSSLGTVNFTRGSAQTLQVDSPVGTNGLAAIGLVFNSAIGTVPTGVSEGGLIKLGDGLMVLSGGSATGFGNPGAATEVFNIAEGYVRVDNVNGLGSVNAITTVQNGAVLLLNQSGSITGSIRLKNGSRMGATITGSVLGAVGSTGFVDIPGGATVQVDAFDSFIPLSNNGNITVNHLLTGSGTMNLVGVQTPVGVTGGGGLFQIRNTSNSFSGTIGIGTNAVAEVSSNTGSTGNTLGTGTIALNGGQFRVRDNNSGVYGNNINLNASSLLDVDRQNGTNTNQTITFGTLTVAAGTHVLSTPYGAGNPIVGNGFRTAFTEVDGAGTLVKGGTRFVDINGYAGGFSGNIAISGPQGLGLSTSGNLVLNAATNSIQNLTVGGFHSIVGGSTVSVAGTVDVTHNTGQVTNGTGGVSTGEIVGALVVDGSSTFTAATLRNNGIVSATGSAAIVDATSVRGSGQFLAIQQDLTVNGAFSNDGATPTTIKVAGSNTVTITAPANTNTGGARVETGTLRLAPTAAASSILGTGPVKVLGIAASALNAGSSATLLFDGGANAVTHTGGIENSGLVRVSTGTATVTGTIAGGTQFLPGLLEGRVTATGGFAETVGNASSLVAGRTLNNGLYGIKLEPRMGQTNVVTQDPRSGWSDNTAWIYTGQFFDADGFFTFIENVDDTVLVTIDGVDVLRNNGGTNPWVTVTSTATTNGQRGTTLDTGIANNATPTLNFGMGANGDGWHDIEIRFYNGGGGAGPAAANGFAANFGFGLNTDGTSVLDGSVFTRPIDPGDGSLFRTEVGGKGDVLIDDGATLNVLSILETDVVTVGTGGAGANLNVFGSSEMDSLVIGAGSVVTFSSAAFPLAGSGGKEASFGSAVVPEPGSMGLLMVGALGLLGRRRRTA